MIARVAARAPATPPETGASTYSKPSSASVRPMLLAAATPMVEVSTMVWVTALGLSRISSTTLRTAAPSGRLRRIGSATAATCTTEFTGVAPSGARSAEPAASWTQSWCPAAARFSAMGRPMFPRPMNPVVVMTVQDSPMSRGLSRPPGRSSGGDRQGGDRQESVRVGSCRATHGPRALAARLAPLLCPETEP